MTEPVEITVRVKGEDKTLKMKHLVYETVTASWTDETIVELMKQAHNEFKGEVEKLVINIKMEFEV